jgi:predicted RNA methylase
LEQYPTSAELTASIVSYACNNEDDLGPGRTALDLGCGTGMLALGCAVVECDAVLAVDCDPDAMAVAKQNAETMEMTDTIDFLLAKVSDTGVIVKKGGSKADAGGGGRGKSRGRGGRGKGGRGGQQQSSSVSLDPDAPDGLPLRDNCVDTVVTNPPFGTKHNAGIDVRFLKAATRLARRAVYSFHKTSTRDYLMKKITTEWGYEARVVAELKFDLPQTYKFQKQKSVDIAVDLIRISIGGDDDNSDEDGGEDVEKDNEVYDD